MKTILRDSFFSTKFQYSYHRLIFILTYKQNIK